MFWKIFVHLKLRCVIFFDIAVILQAKPQLLSKTSKLTLSFLKLSFCFSLVEQSKATF